MVVIQYFLLSPITIEYRKSNVASPIVSDIPIFFLCWILSEYRNFCRKCRPLLTWCMLTFVHSWVTSCFSWMPVSIYTERACWGTCILICIHAYLKTWLVACILFFMHAWVPAYFICMHAHVLSYSSACLDANLLTLCMLGCRHSLLRA